MNGFNARAETWKHIHRVGELVLGMVKELVDRAVKHDASKLEEPEAGVFEANTEKLASLTYGSPEYQASTAALGPALKHHYANNRHHPEWHRGKVCGACNLTLPNDEPYIHCPLCGDVLVDGPIGIRGMTLVDLLEMLCDWKAASERHDDGCIMQSIIKQQEKLKFSDDLAQILRNTAREYFGAK